MTEKKRIAMLEGMLRQKNRELRERKEQDHVQGKLCAECVQRHHCERQCDQEGR